MDNKSSEYKQRCDEVILTRAGSNAGVVFDECMSDDEVMKVLQDCIDGS